MSTHFLGKSIALAITFMIVWGLIGLVIDGPPGIGLFALTLGPVFAIAGIMLMAYDLRFKPRNPIDWDLAP